MAAASPPARVYHVGAEQFGKAGDAVDRAREIARELAAASPQVGHHDVLVVRSDGDSVRIRGFLSSRGRSVTVTVPKPGRRW